MSRWVSLLVVILATPVFADTAAEDTPKAKPSGGCQAIDDFHFGISGLVGIPVIRDLKWDPSFQAGAAKKAQLTASLDDMKVVTGGALWGDYNVYKRGLIILAVGGEVRFGYSLPGVDAGWMLDVDPYVKFIYKAHRVVSILVRAAPGLSVWSPDWSIKDIQTKSNFNFPTGIGFNIALSFGAQFEVGGGVGLLVDVGYIHRMTFGNTSWEGQETQGHASYSDSFTLSSGMVQASVGVVF